MEEYYMNQAGNGLPYFQGVRYQKGHGFFGRLFKGGIVPILKYFGSKLLDGGIEMTKDIAGGESIKGAARKQIQNKVGEVAGDLFEKFAQRGKGIKRKRKCHKIIKNKKLSKPRKHKKQAKSSKYNFL
jgi:hypothetical protein